MLRAEYNSVKDSIFKRIKRSKPHRIFFLSDFAQYGSIETVRKVFTQARIEGMLTRVAHGIYVKPLMSRFGEVPVSIEIVAQEIAKRDHVQIIPTGATAANILGLSTQIPMTVSYLTSGSTRTVKIGKQAVKFKHAAPKNFAYKGTTIPLFVHAFKDLGKENIGSNEISALIKYLRNAKDAQTFQSDILLAPQWIQDIVKPILYNIENS